MAAREYPSVQSINTKKDFLNMFMVGVGVVLLFFYTRIIRNKKHWIYLECATTAFFVIWSAVLGIWMPSLDSATIYFIRLRVACMVSQAMASYFTEDSSDRTVPIAVSISNLLIRSPTLVAVLSHLKDLKPGVAKFLYLEFFILLLLLIGNLYQVMMSKTRIFSHRTVGDPISFHLSIDGLLTFILGTVVLGFPDMLLSKLVSVSVTSHQLWLFQLWGIMLLGGAILSFASLCYRDDDDAVNTLKAKLIVYLAAVFFAITYFITDAHFRTFGHVGVMVGLMTILVWNAGQIVYNHYKED